MKQHELSAMLVKGSGGGGGKGGGGSSATPRVAQEEPNTLQSKATLRIVEAISEGEIYGLVNAGQSIFFDNTPYQEPNGSINFQGVTYSHREGTPDQDYIPGFSAIEEETSVAVKLMFGIPIVRTITNPDVNAIRVTLGIPALTYQDPSTGDLQHNWTGYKIEVQNNGGAYQVVFNSYIQGKTTSPYEAAFRITLNNYISSDFPLNLRVSRTRADNTHAYEQTDLYWARYTQIIDDKLIYPDTALVALTVDSSLFGNSIPTRSYDIKGVKIKIPTNYNPTTRAYTGVWDGTFQTAWSDNPAWVLYDLLTKVRYGIGQFINAAEVDKFALYSIAQYCDELVPNGNGSTEPRFTFNGVIESQDNAMKIIQAVASAFRGMLYWGAEGNSGIVVPFQDAPADATKIFTQANVVGGLFTYSGSSLSARHSIAYVSWSDPSNNYAPSIEVIEDPSLLSLYGFRKLDVIAYGCTSRGQAHRLGKWMLYSEASETETVQFSVGLADADVRPGDIVNVQDSHYANARFGGRLAAATLTTATLDSSIVIENFVSYTLTVVLPNGKLFDTPISNAAGTYTTVTVATAFLTTPDVNAMWVITSSSLSPRQFRIIDVKESSDAQFDITGLLYDSTKYDRVEQNLNLPTLTYTTLQTGKLAAPTNLTYQEYLYQAGSLIQSAIVLSWQASADSRVVRYEVEYQSPAPVPTGGISNIYRFAGGTQGVSLDIKTTFDGTWSFRVRGFDALGNFGDYAVLSNVSLGINASPPADVTDFNIDAIGSTSILRWTGVNSLNLDHYEIRYTADVVSPSWSAAQIIVESVSKNSHSATVASRSGSYLIKAVSVTSATYPNGVYSVNADIISTDIDALLTFNFIQIVSEEPTFSGAKTNCLVDGGALILDFNGFDWDAVANVDALANSDSGGFPFYVQGTYTFANTFDLGAVYISRLSSILTAAGLNINNLVDEWLDVDAILNVDAVNDSDWDVQLEIRTTNDNPAGSPVWSDWSRFQVSDYSARAFQFRAQLYSHNASVTPSITQLEISIDMPDSLRSGNDIAVTSAGIAVVYSTPFKSTNPAIGIAAQNMATGDYFTITSKTASGFFIRFFNASNVAIGGRTFDYVARGYGYG